LYITAYRLRSTCQRVQTSSNSCFRFLWTHRVEESVVCSAWQQSINE